MPTRALCFKLIKRKDSVAVSRCPSPSATTEVVLFLEAVGREVRILPPYSPKSRCQSLKNGRVRLLGSLAVFNNGE